MTALYYGTYVSQDLVRKTVGDKEILFGPLMEGALKALQFNFISYGKEKDIKNYFQWLKNQLKNNRPVIVATKHAKNNKRNYWYDHIVLAVGYSAEKLSQYNHHDSLFYNECHLNKVSHQTFKTFQDDTVHNYFNQTNHYGVAITGYMDTKSETYPVQLTLDNWNEPHKNPTKFKVQIKISSLKIGKNYILLKYTDYQKVPSKDFYLDQSHIFKKFHPQTNKITFEDSFMSNEFISYRCVEVKD